MNQYNYLHELENKEIFIRNLHYQISALRKLLEDNGFSDKEIDVIQFAHIKENKS